MTKREQPSIDPELIGALRAYGAKSPGSAVQARVFARLETRLAALAVPVAGVASTAAADAAASPAADLLLPDVVSPSAPSLLVSALTKPVGIAVISAALGGAGTYALTENTQPIEAPSHHVVSVPAPPNTRRAPAMPNTSRAPAVESHTEVRQEPLLPRQVTPPSSKEPVVRATSAPEPNTTSPSAVSLGQQQALLDTARKALARGDNQAVLNALAEHSDRYPQSDLVEEREALAIKALVAAGQYAAARERGARFNQRFPSSLLMPSVGAALRAIP